MLENRGKQQPKNKPTKKEKVVKKLCVFLVALAFLIVAQVGYAQIGGTVQIPPVGRSQNTVVGLRLLSELAYNESVRDAYYVPIQPCRMASGSTLIGSGETKLYPVTGSSACSQYVPVDAVAVSITVTAFGIAAYSPDWNFLGGAVDITSPNSITDSGSGMLGNPKPAFAYFQTGVVASASGIADLRPVSVDLMVYKGLGVKVTDGEARVAVDVLGYFLPR